MNLFKKQNSTKAPPPMTITIHQFNQQMMTVREYARLFKDKKTTDALQLEKTLDQMVKCPQRNIKDEEVKVIQIVKLMCTIESMERIMALTQQMEGMSSQVSSCGGDASKIPQIIPYLATLCYLIEMTQDQRGLGEFKEKMNQYFKCDVASQFKQSIDPTLFEFFIMFKITDQRVQNYIYQFCKKYNVLEISGYPKQQQNQQPQNTNYNQYNQQQGYQQQGYQQQGYNNQYAQQQQQNNQQSQKYQPQPQGDNSQPQYGAYPQQQQQPNRLSYQQPTPQYPQNLQNATDVYNNKYPPNIFQNNPNANLPQMYPNLGKSNMLGIVKPNIMNTSTNKNGSNYNYPVPSQFQKSVQGTGQQQQQPFQQLQNNTNQAQQQIDPFAKIELQNAQFVPLDPNLKQSQNGGQGNIQQGGQGGQQGQSKLQQGGQQNNSQQGQSGYPQGQSGYPQGQSGYPQIGQSGQQGNQKIGQSIQNQQQPNNYPSYQPSNFQTQQPSNYIGNPSQATFTANQQIPSNNQNTIPSQASQKTGSFNQDQKASQQSGQSTPSIDQAKLGNPMDQSANLYQTNIISQGMEASDIIGSAKQRVSENIQGPVEPIVIAINHDLRSLKVLANYLTMKASLKTGESNLMREINGLMIDI